MARRTVAQFWGEVRRAVTDGQMRALDEGSKLLYQATLDELARGSPGGGRSYRRGRKTHRASVAGAAPARDTGTLNRAIGRRLNWRELNAVVGVKDSAPYAKFLDPAEDQPEPRIGRRPFLSSAVENNRDAVAEAMADELERSLRQVGR